MNLDGTHVHRQWLTAIDGISQVDLKSGFCKRKRDLFEAMKRLSIKHRVWYMIDLLSNEK